jgi:hypothetical protein
VRPPQPAQPSRLPRRLCRLRPRRHRTGRLVQWDTIPGYVERAPLSSSEANILRLVAELGGTDTATPLAELLSNLDDSNARMVVGALAHALRLDRDGSRR